MKFKQLTVLLIFLLIFPLFLDYSLLTKAVTIQTTPSLYVGVDVAFESIATTEQLIDNISSYTNFFIIGCYGDYNETRLTLISQYVFDKGLTFIVYTDDPRYPSRQWLQDAKSNWGNSFLGIYYYDEPGGKQLDQSKYPVVTAADNYSDAANKYVNDLNWWLRSGPHAITRSFGDTQYKLFTSDYSLYWYDYEAGYDTVFAEFALNYSRQLNIDLCRGAATVHNKDWGIMITNAYTQPAHMESGPDLYKDMLLAYENGAKYIIVFDSDENWTQNVLQQDHLDAMKQFWLYVQTHPRTISSVSDRSAYVLPEDYAYGFRGPLDRIWGLWPNDSLTLDVSMSMATLFQIFGNNLDIVYPDGPRTIESIGYRNVVYWNDSRLIPDLLPITSPDPVQNVPTKQPTPSPHLQQDTLLPFYLIVASILVAITVGFTVLKSKISRRTESTTTTILVPHGRDFPYVAHRNNCRTCTVLLLHIQRRLLSRRAPNHSFIRTINSICS
jgi:hypothetical protein